MLPHLGEGQGRSVSIHGWIGGQAGGRSMVGNRRGHLDPLHGRQRDGGFW